LAARILVLAVVVALLWATGLLELNLPWEDPVFQVSGVCVAVYLLWSLAEGARKRPGMNLSQLAMYVVLLVSALDSFVLDVTVFLSPLVLRWAGAVLLLAGCCLRLAAVYLSAPQALLRAGRAMQLVGLPLGLGSLSGLVVGAVPGMVVALRTDESDSFGPGEEGPEEL